jgi:hypothetical protein
MTKTLKADVRDESSSPGRPQRDAAIGTVCMALALASAVLLMRAVSVF